MALLMSPDILPEAMRFLVRALLALKGHEADRDELLALVAPPGLAEAMKNLEADIAIEDDGGRPEQRGGASTGGLIIATNSLDGLRTLGVVVDLDGKRVKLAREAAQRWARPEDVTARSFRNFLLDCFIASLQPEVPAGRSDGVMDLARTLELLYTADNPLTPFDRFESGTKGRAFLPFQDERCGPKDRWPLGNKERWLPFRRWASYLGLVKLVADNGVVADASDALAHRLAHCPSGTYAAAEFVARCAAAVPLLDGGVLQTRFAPERSGSTEVLSPAMSMTLRQMEADGTVKFDKQSDTDVRVLRLRSDRSADVPITTIEFTQGARDGGVA
ncbi:hypothetical protein [Actinokineospora sp. NPDC004072]